MKKITKARLAGEAISRTIEILKEDIHLLKGQKIEFDPHGMSVEPWQNDQEGICELTLKNQENNDETVIFSVAIEPKGKSLDFDINGSNSHFIAEHHYFTDKKSGSYVLQSLAAHLESAFQIPAYKFLSEFNRQAIVVRGEHNMRKQAKRALRTLGF